MKYRKKPVVIDAFQWTGGNPVELQEWIEEIGGKDPGITFKEHNCLNIPTLEGDHKALPGDYIIMGVQGEFYPCKPHIFEKTYEPASPGSEPDSEPVSHGLPCSLSEDNNTLQPL